MGFYASDTLAHEAQRRGIPMLGADVNESAAECTVAADGSVRIGLGYVSGVRGDEVAALVAAREEGGRFRSLADLASRAGAGRPSLEKLAWAGACDALAGIDASADGANRARRSALWQLGVAAPGEPGREGTQLALPLETPAPPELRELAPWESMVADYAATGLTLGEHPLALLRGQLPEGTVSCRDLERMRHEAPVTIGGLVVARQRPGTAKGIVFLLLEDEFGTINLIVPPDVYERHRLTVRTEPLILARGRLEKLAMAGGAINVFVKSLEPLVTPDADVAGVVELAERRAAAAAAEAPADRSAAAADPSAILADFRGVAPAVQSFAAGRRR
jgi:error-prone DNA polymerase